MLRFSNVNFYRYAENVLSTALFINSMMQNNTVMKQKRHSSSERSEPHTRSLTLMSLTGSTNTCRRSWCEIKIEIIFRREGRVKEGGRDWAGAKNLNFCCFVHFIFQSNMLLREIYLKKKVLPFSP